jgi:2-methylcitrate dehydratase
MFGGKVEITLSNGEKIVDELGVANAHPAGAKPFKRADYIRKFDMLTADIITKSERDRFIGLVENLPQLTSEQLKQLNVQIPLDKLTNHKRDEKGIF